MWCIRVLHSNRKIPCPLSTKEQKDWGLQADLKRLSISRHTASVTLFVFSPPPRSLVLIPLAVTFSIAFINPSAAFSSPTHLTISAALQNAPTGFAMPLPAISGAEPWMGSNMLGLARVGSRLLDGAIPILPERAAARSERMSACRLVATIVSRLFGCSTIRTVMASTSILSISTSPYSFATS